MCRRFAHEHPGARDGGGLCLEMRVKELSDENAALIKLNSELGKTNQELEMLKILHTAVKFSDLDGVERALKLLGKYFESESEAHYSGHKFEAIPGPVCNGTYVIPELGGEPTLVHSEFLNCPAHPDRADVLVKAKAQT